MEPAQGRDLQCLGCVAVLSVWIPRRFAPQSGLRGREDDFRSECIIDLVNLRPVVLAAQVPAISKVDGKADLHLGSLLGFETYAADVRPLLDNIPFELLVIEM